MDVLLSGVRNSPVLRFSLPTKLSPIIFAGLASGKKAKGSICFTQGREAEEDADLVFVGLVLPIMRDAVLIVCDVVYLWTVYRRSAL
jgi:hypothetical protein